MTILLAEYMDKLMKILSLEYTPVKKKFKTGKTWIHEYQKISKSPKSSKKFPENHENSKIHAWIDQNKKRKNCMNTHHWANTLENLSYWFFYFISLFRNFSQKKKRIKFDFISRINEVKNLFLLFESPKSSYL